MFQQNLMISPDSSNRQVEASTPVILLLSFLKDLDALE